MESTDSESNRAITPTWRGRLFRRYALAIVGLVAGSLLLSSSINIYFSYDRIRESLSQLQIEKARSAAALVGAFIDQVQLQVSEALKEVALDQTPEQQRDTLRRLLRAAPAVTEAAYLDSSGRELLAVSRLSTDRLSSGNDRSSEEAFVGTRGGKSYFSPVSFRSDSQPYMTIAKGAQGSSGGAIVADLNLTFVQEVISGLDLERGGYAFVVDSQGLLVAHLDLTLVLRKTDLNHLDHVASALSESRAGERASTTQRSIGGVSVLSAHELVSPMGWFVFVEQPTSQAFASLRAHILRTIAVFVVGLALAIFTSVFLARRLAKPIAELHHGASAIGAGNLDYEIDVRTRDELEDLAGEFNEMRRQLQGRLDELRASRLRLVTAQDEERRRMERDIHDGAQQQLVSMSVKLGLLKRLLSRDPDKVSKMLDEVSHESSEALTTLRDLARGLYPPALRDEGLVGALAGHVNRLPVQVELDVNDLRGVRFPQEVEGQVYFCIREALQNASKYAGGAPIVVSLARTNGYLEFSVTDAGPGFDPETVKRGAGLQNISDRLETLGGELILSSTPGSGSTVGGRVPLEKE